MRIATSTIYAQQTAAIDNQSAQYAQLGQELSSGIAVSEPSDDPQQIGQDLELHATIATQTQQSTNATAATNQLTQTDSALNGVTSLLQSANSLAEEAANTALSSTDRSAIVSQLNDMIDQAVSYGNSEYNGTYVFAGTASATTPPVQAVGNPPTSVTFSGNEQTQGQVINGQSMSLSTSFQSAFNYDASDGSPSVFQVLINLRNQVENPQYSDVSQAAINASGQVVYGTPSGGGQGPTTLVATPPATSAFATPPVPGTAGGGGWTIDVNGTAINIANVPPATMQDVVNAINAQSGTTGVYAQFNTVATPNGTPAAPPAPAFPPADAQTFQLVSSSSAFTVSDATNGGNLVEALGLSGTGDSVQPISTQLGDISNALNVVLNARATVGANLQQLSSVSSQLQTDVTDNTNVESNIEDTPVAATTTEFTATQTALEAAYATTTRLEQQTLINYLGQ